MTFDKLQINISLLLFWVFLSYSRSSDVTIGLSKIIWLKTRNMKMSATMSIPIYMYILAFSFHYAVREIGLYYVKKRILQILSFSTKFTLVQYLYLALRNNVWLWSWTLLISFLNRCSVKWEIEKLIAISLKYHMS